MSGRENRPPKEPARPTAKWLQPKVDSKPGRLKILIQAENQGLASPATWFERLKRELSSGVTGVVVSLSIHMVALFLLGMIVFHSAEGLESTPGLIATFLTPEQIKQRELRAAQATEVVQIQAVTVNPAGQIPETTEGPKPKEAEQPVAPQSEILPSQPASVGQALTGRTAENRKSLLQLFGGTRQTEDAVGRGLGWLVKNQQSDGRWELHRGYDNAGRQNLRTDTGATSLALLCFLGAGYTHQEGKYKEVVKKGLNWLKKIQKADGNLHDWDELGRQTAFYAHGQGTIALCEAFALTQDPALLPAARKALQFIYTSQNDNGGWQYQPGAVGDLSVTGWQVMAIQSARMAGIEVPEEVLLKVQLFLNSVSSQNGSRYRYKASDPDSLFSPAMTAEGLLCRQYLGWPKEHPALQDGVQWMLDEDNLPRWSEGKRNVYYWYYATQVMHHMEGDAWEKWNNALRDQISSNQIKGGSNSGSWNPHKPHGVDHEYAEAGGRLYITCLSILTLEVYYRHLPLYRDALPVNSESRDAD